MTIQTRRLPILPWWLPLNTRELKPEERVVYVKILSEGTYIYKLTAIDANSANATCELPYHFNGQGEITSSEPTRSSSIIKKEQINSFGPENPNWRWKKSKES